MGLWSSQPSTKRMAYLCRELAALARSDIPIIRSIELIAEHNRPLHVLLTRLADRLHTGATMAEALRAESARFPPFFVETIAVAEQAGAIGRALGHLADYYEEQLSIRRAFIRALIYPACVLLTAAYVIPVFAFIALATYRELPSSAIGHFLLRFFGGVAAQWLIIFGVLRFLSWLGLLRRLRGFVAGHVPPFAILFRRFAIARFLRGFALQLDSGLSVGPSLRNAAALTAIPAVQRDLLRAVASIQQGRPLHEAFTHVRRMPPLALQMLHTGEQAGRTGDSLKRAGDYLNDQANHTLRIIAHVAEAVTIVVVAAMIFGGCRIAGILSAASSTAH